MFQNNQQRLTYPVSADLFGLTYVAVELSLVPEFWHFTYNEIFCNLYLLFFERHWIVRSVHTTLQCSINSFRCLEIFTLSVVVV